jgi:hypothetical protein
MNEPRLNLRSACSKGSSAASIEMSFRRYRNVAMAVSALLLIANNVPLPLMPPGALISFTGSMGVSSTFISVMRVTRTLNNSPKVHPVSS